MSTVRKAGFVAPAAQRAAWEALLEERLGEEGFIVTSREVSRDGPWRIDIFGDGSASLVEGAIATAARALGIAAPDWSWEELPDIDWVAENQRSFQPFAVGPFWVHPSHVTDGRPAGLLPLRIDADLIVANILAGPLVDLSESFAAALRPGGRVLLSGLLVEQAALILSAYARRGLAFERRLDLETGGAWWRSLLLRRAH